MFNHVTCCVSIFVVRRVMPETIAIRGRDESDSIGFMSMLKCAWVLYTYLFIYWSIFILVCRCVLIYKSFIYFFFRGTFCWHFMTREKKAEKVAFVIFLKLKERVLLHLFNNDTFLSLSFYTFTLWLITTVLIFYHWMLPLGLNYLLLLLLLLLP